MSLVAQESLIALFNRWNIIHRKQSI